MNYLLLILLASSAANAHGPAQALTMSFESKSACEFAAAWAQDAQTKTACIPAKEEMWNNAPPPPKPAEKREP